MSNENQNSDLKASKLISQSFHGPLDDHEQRFLEQSMSENSEARAFNKLSTMIQESFADVAAKSLAGDTSIAPGMSEDTKQRLRDSIELAKKSSGAPDTAVIPTTSSPAPHNQGDLRQATSRFRLIRKIGQGGLGNVWLAYDEKIKRKVAIKSMMSDAVRSPKAWQRFHREAEVTGLLEHPNVVPLYQYGTDPSTNEPFYAMRFVGKRTLADAIVEYQELLELGEADELGMHRLLTVFLDVCQAIAYAHSRGVIHRDLKPDNVALDNFGQVVVLDWGLAKLLDDSEISDHVDEKTHDSFDSALTRTMAGEIVGTPLYMAPEQAVGDHDNVDERTDVYGLGAILFSVLTGSAPHEKTNTSKDGHLRIKDFLEAIATRETPRARDYCESVPRELERICLKAMSKKPFARFQTAGHLASAVERWMAGQSDKASRYENLRMEGRELRSSFQSTASTLETNARFVSTLPPIQELIHVESTDDSTEDSATEDNATVWRRRLAKILTGLLDAIGDYSSIVYSKIDGDQFQELVRVERHRKEHSKVRPIPRSRLKSGATNDFIRQIIANNPDEVLVSMICDPLCDQVECDRPQLVAGIPIYDEQTEEPFGVILIACNLERVFEKQMSQRTSAHEIIAACDTHHVMMHFIDGSMKYDTRSQPVASTSPHFNDATSALQTQCEYIDETDHEVYGARLWLIPKKHGLMYLLRNKS